MHGAPPGENESAAAGNALDLPYEPFDIPRDIHQRWDARPRGARLQAQWQSAFDAYAAAYPDLAAELQRRLSGELPADFAQRAAAFIAATDAKAETDRKSTRLNSSH